MAALSIFLLLVFSACSSGPSLVDANTFDEDFVVTWGQDHVTTFAAGQGLQLMLDQTSGSSFQSKQRFLFGSISMQIKLVPDDSAGVVTAYYMASEDAATRDELDFEFLGNTSGQPYILQTNLFTYGKGDREQRIYLWFDPTTDFHTYSFLWNDRQILFLVDDIPIRVFQNSEEKGLLFPNRQGMGIYSSIWNADQWATQGGLVKTDWSHAPFISTYQNFVIDACDLQNNRTSADPLCLKSKWWSQQPYQQLTPNQLANLQWVKQNYIIYDYCKDTQRFQGQFPLECSINP